MKTSGGSTIPAGIGQIIFLCELWKQRNVRLGNYADLSIFRLWRPFGFRFTQINMTTNKYFHRSASYLSVRSNKSISRSRLRSPIYSRSEDNNSEQTKPNCICLVNGREADEVPFANQSSNNEWIEEEEREKGGRWPDLALSTENIDVKLEHIIHSVESKRQDPLHTTGIVNQMVTIKFGLKTQPISLKRNCRKYWNKIYKSTHLYEMVKSSLLAIPHH